MKFWFKEQKKNLEFLNTKIIEKEKIDEDISKNFNHGQFQTLFLETIQVQL